MINPFNLDISKMKTMSDSLNAELEKTILEGEAGAGMVKAKATGTGKIVSVEVTDEVYAMGDRNDMCVLIVSAVNAALDILFSLASGEISHKEISGGSGSTAIIIFFLIN